MPETWKGPRAHLLFLPPSPARLRVFSKNGIRIDSDKFTPKIIEGYKPHRRKFCAHFSHQRAQKSKLTLPFSSLLFPPSLPVVRSVEEAADTAYAFVIITTKSLPDILPTEAMLEPIIKAGKSKTFVLIQNGLGIEEGIYAATRAIDATILTSVCYISTNLVGNRDEVRFEVSCSPFPLVRGEGRRGERRAEMLTRLSPSPLS